MNLKPPLWAPGIDLSHPLAQGLVGCWAMWEGGGDTVRDLCAGNDATWTNPVQPWVVGEEGVACNFTNSTNRLLASNASELNPDYISVFAVTHFDAAGHDAWAYVCTKDANKQYQFHPKMFQT